MTPSPEEISLPSGVVRRAVLLAIAQAILMATVFNFVGPRYSNLLTGDVGYFLGDAKHLVVRGMPYRDFTFEYPPGALAPVVVPLVLNGGSTEATPYLWAFVAQMAVLAGVITIVLARSSGLRSAVVFNALLAIGVAYVPLRFDLLPALLTLLAVLWAIDRPARSGVMLALGMIVKLYPAVLLPVLVMPHLAAGRNSAAVRWMLGFVATLAVILVPVSIATNFHAFDFVAFHSLRGLQIESIGGGLLLLAGKLHLTTVSEETSFFSSNLVSPWAGPIVKCLLPMMCVVLLCQFITLWRRWRSAPPAVQEIAFAAATTLGVFVVFSRVFSPQYLVWAIPLIVLFTRRLWAIGIVCGMTAVIFPFKYPALTHQHGWAIVFLNGRNAIVVAMVIYGLVTRPRNKISPVAS